MTDDKTWRDLPEYWKLAAVDEWRSRTAFGKLLYPVWLLGAVLTWVAALSVLLVLSIPFAIVWLTENYVPDLPDTHQ